MIDDADSDCDWLAVAAGGQEESAPARGEEEHATALAVVPARKRGAYAVPLAAPSKRSPLEAAYAAAHMRERRQELRENRKLAVMEGAVNLLSKDLTRGDVRVGTRKTKQHRCTVVVYSTKLRGKNVRHGLTFERLLDVAFDTIIENKKLAKGRRKLQRPGGARRRRGR